MTLGGRRCPRDRRRRPAAFPRGLLVLAASLTCAQGALAQNPPDTLGVPQPPVAGADQVPDSLPRSGQVPDSLAAADTVSADTIFHNLPELPRGTPVGFATGVWEWDRDAIMASGANTVAEIVANVPGVVLLLGGDYGTPLAVTAFGAGGAGVRVLRDGFDVLPLDGGVADLQRVGLGGVSHVRLERSPGELLIELTTYEYDDGRPFSLVEAGTGQLDTNLFRGTFADPTAFGGSVALALERVDTRGYGTDEGGNRTGVWVRYQLNAGDRAGLALDYRTMNSSTQVADYAAKAKRSDITLRARVEVVEGVVAEAYTGRSTLSVRDARVEYGFDGGRRAQHGVRLGLRRQGLWARGEYRLFPDDDLPSRRVDGAVGFTSERLGAWGRVSEAGWGGSSLLRWSAGGWLAPLSSVALFGSYETGEHGARTGPVRDVVPEPVPPFLPATPPDETFATAERATLRLGGSVSLLGATVAAAALRSEVDTHLPLGTDLDVGSPSAPGTERRGLEAWASLPTRWRSLRLEGSYQVWDADGPYLPKQLYTGALVFHRTYLESGNFELWWSVGVRGHDRMDVFVADDGQGGPGGLARVPFYQWWYGTIQARIVSVRLFFGWENLAVRRNLQTYPGRLLPITRSFFGLRWDLWN